LDYLQKIIKIQNQAYRVVGVIKSKGGGGFGGGGFGGFGGGSSGGGGAGGSW